LCRKKRRLYCKAKSPQNPTDREAYKQSQNITRNELKKAHWSHVNKILIDGLQSGDTMPFYRYIKSQQQDNQGISSLCVNGQLFSDAR